MSWTAAAIRRAGSTPTEPTIPWRAFAEGPTCTRRVVAGAHLRQHQVHSPAGIDRSHDVKEIVSQAGSPSLAWRISRL
jgi:hypothetical protein